MFVYFLCLFGNVWLSEAGSRGMTFQDPGLVWLEALDEGSSHVRFQRMPIDPTTWSLHATDQPETIAMTERGNHPYTFVDVDYENRTFVTVDKSRKKIMAVSFDEDGFQIHWQLFEGTSNKVNGIAMDWTTDVVYWTDAVYNAIFAVSLATPNIAETIIEDLDEPYGIATHPMKGFLFWTDVGDHPKIMRSSLGGRRHSLVIEFVDNSSPKAITVDYAENRLYWLFGNTQQRNQDIGSSDLYGNDPKTIRLREGGFYFDLDVFQGSIFLSNQAYKEIHVIPKSSKKPIIRMRLPNGKPYGLVVLDRERQTERSNPCLEPTCPGVCTRSNSSIGCFCHAELKKTAEPDVVKRYCARDAFRGILIPKGDGIFSMVQNFAEFIRPTKIKPRKILGSQKPIRALTSDTRLMKIFYYESITKIVKSLKLINGSQTDVVSYAVGDIGGLAIDGASENLYWTDQQYGHIMVSKTDGSFAYKLIDNLGKPKAIAVYPRSMFLYWSNMKDYSLNRCYLDGTDCLNLLPGHRYKINDIVIDFKTDKLYWVHRGARSAVYTSDLDGHGIREIYLSRGSLFTGVAVMHDYVIVSDSSYLSGGLHALEKTSYTLVGKITYSKFEYGNWFGVDFLHNSSEPRRRTSACDLRRNPCDQICIPSNTKARYKCFCSVGYRVDDTDSNKCVIGSDIEFRYLPLVLFVDKRLQKLMYISFTSQFVVIPVQQIKQPYSVAFDLKMKQVYWSDLETGTISRADLDGRNQEIIIAQSDAYFISLAVDPRNRLLFYIVLKWREVDSKKRELRSLVAYDIEQSKSVILVDGTLSNPASLALNTEQGHVLLVEQGYVCRVDMNGSNLRSLTDKTVQSTLVATNGEYVYFTKEINYDDFYKPKAMQIWRCDLDGHNKTLLLELDHGEMSSLKVYEDRNREFLYWTNMSTRAIQRFPLSRSHRGIENVGPSHQLFLPTDIFVDFVDKEDESVCSTTPTDCDGICLPSPNGPSCVDKNRTVAIHIAESNRTKEFCQIPSIQYGEVVGYKESLVVPHGFRVSVECFPLHKISRRSPMTCYKGKWNHIPKCTLEYDICGDEFQGYKAYTESGPYFVYPGATKVDVICIGGGGGGYDATNDAEAGGDGGDSRFSTYLVAYGGKGGSLLKGGAGGAGHRQGGDGSASVNCTTGGTAGEDERSTRLGVPGVSHNLLCGGGGYSDDCDVGDFFSGNRLFAGPGGRDGNGSIAGQYGGGAGSRTGGTGGGGGYSRLSFSLSPKAVVDVEVGMAGNPSYGQAGQGIVLVTWGGLKIDEHVEAYDIVNECVFERLALRNERQNMTMVMTGRDATENNLT